VKADRRTLATDVPGVFAAGECVAGPTAGVRAVAAGRLAALSIAQHLSGQPVVGETELLHVRLGKLTDAQKPVLFRGFLTQPRAAQLVADWRVPSPSPFGGGEGGGAQTALPVLAPSPCPLPMGGGEVEQGLSRDAAVREASRCLQCDCAARDACRLRQIGTEYGAEVNRFAGEARELDCDESHPSLVYESGKCILCQLCTRISDQERERLGMALARRGFVTRVRVPFGKSLAEGLTAAAERCAAACPTGALAHKRRVMSAKCQVPSDE
jgi:formate dehydrogenase major subunit